MKSLLVLFVVACGPPPRDPTVILDAATVADAHDAIAVDAPTDAYFPPHIDAAVGPGGDPFGALQALPGYCSVDNWCWWMPKPVGNSYARIASSAPDNIWLTAGGGTVLQWNGQSWISHRPPVLPGEQIDQYPFAIATSAGNDTWLIFGTKTLHWDGATWTILDQLPTTGNPQFLNIWMAPDDSAWITISNGTINHWHDGIKDTIAVGCGCFIGSIWGTATDDIFVTTIGGIYHFDGTTFSPTYTAGTTAAWYQGTRRDTWVSGQGGDLLHWDGNAWIKIPTGLTGNVTIQTVGYLSSDDAWWYAYTSSQDVSFIHWDGHTVQVTPIDESTEATTFDCCTSITQAAIIDGRWWLVGGSGGIWTKVGAAQVKPIIEPALLDTLAMWGPSEDDLYFAWGGGVRHWDGAHLTSTALPVSNLAGQRLAEGSDELFGTGFGIDFTTNQYLSYMFHFAHGTWTQWTIEIDPPGVYAFTNVWPIGPGEALATGYKGRLAHFSNGAWHLLASGTTEDLGAMWGPDADHVWIGGNGHVYQWTRATDAIAADAAFPGTGTINTLDGIGQTLWVSSFQGLTAYRRGPNGTWTAFPEHVQANSLVAISEDNVVVSSASQSRLLRFNGSDFVEEYLMAWYAMGTLFHIPGGATYATNGDGILRHP